MNLTNPLDIVKMWSQPASIVGPNMYSRACSSAWNVTCRFVDTRPTRGSPSTVHIRIRHREDDISEGVRKLLIFCPGHRSGSRRSPAPLDIRLIASVFTVFGRCCWKNSWLCINIERDFCFEWAFSGVSVAFRTDPCILLPWSIWWRDVPGSRDINRQNADVTSIHDKLALTWASNQGLGRDLP